MRNWLCFFFFFFHFKTSSCRMWHEMVLLEYFSASSIPATWTSKNLADVYKMCTDRDAVSETSLKCKIACPFLLLARHLSLPRSELAQRKGKSEGRWEKKMLLIPFISLSFSVLISFDFSFFTHRIYFAILTLTFID